MKRDMIAKNGKALQKPITVVRDLWETWPRRTGIRGELINLTTQMRSVSANRKNHQIEDNTIERTLETIPM